ncbi:MAG: hypothetical protein WEA35_07430 [Candidatus Nanopelagicales bacterium]
MLRLEAHHEIDIVEVVPGERGAPVSGSTHADGLQCGQGAAARGQARDGPRAG